MSVDAKEIVRPFRRKTISTFAEYGLEWCGRVLAASAKERQGGEIGKEGAREVDALLDEMKAEIEEAK